MRKILGGGRDAGFVPSNPVREFSDGLLILGGVVLVFAVGLAAAEVVVASTGGRNYAFSGLAPAGIGLAIVLLAAGGLLRALSPRPRLRPR